MKGLQDLKAQSVGACLRAVRQHAGMSLDDVEAVSGQRFKASTVGAYERGARTISVFRLQELAKFYRVSVDEVLRPKEPLNGWELGLKESGEDARADARLPRTREFAWRGSEKIAIDLARLRELNGREGEFLLRFLTMIQMQRRMFNWQVIVIRNGDVRTIACVFGLTPSVMCQRLDELGVRVGSGAS